MMFRLPAKTQFRTSMVRSGPVQASKVQAELAKFWVARLYFVVCQLNVHPYSINIRLHKKMRYHLANEQHKDKEIITTIS